MLKAQKGFAILETLLILVILGVIIGVGWYAIHTKHQTDRILSQADKISQQTSNKSSTINQKYSFAYCNKKGPFAYSDVEVEYHATFLGYDSLNNTITYKNNDSGKVMTDGWCSTPLVEDKNKQKAELKDLKQGDLIYINADDKGIRAIYIK